MICPGSRSTPLAVSLAAHPDIRVWVLIDERAAAFFALGMARQLAAPVAILSTSGTAAANFLPAVVEARLSRIPLIVLTADRPPELRDWGAAQTIDQIQLFGSHAKWFVDMPVPAADDALVRHARATAARAVQTARIGPSRAGPSQFPVPRAAASRGPGGHSTSCGRCSGTDATRTIMLPKRTRASCVPAAASVDELASQIAREPRGIIVCGPGEAPGLAAAAAALSEASGYPILADPLSGVRFGPHDRTGVIDAYDPFLRDQETADVAPTRARDPRRRCPDLQAAPAIPAGPSGPSAGRDRRRRHRGIRPISRRATSLRTPRPRLPPSPSRVADLGGSANRGVARRLESRGSSRPRAAIESALAREDEPFEGRAVAEVAALLPEGATLVVGNSMPIRDVDAFVRGDQRRLRIVSNRGANGIDGVVSTALGAAAVADGPVVLIVGDLSFFHDLNGLLAASKVRPGRHCCRPQQRRRRHLFVSSSGRAARRADVRSAVRDAYRSRCCARRPGSSAHRTLDPGLGRLPARALSRHATAAVCRSSSWSPIATATWRSIGRSGPPSPRRCGAVPRLVHEMSVVRANGIDFHVEDHGNGTPLVLLHGFTGSAASWSPVSQRTRQDPPGHRHRHHRSRGVLCPRRPFALRVRAGSARPRRGHRPSSASLELPGSATRWAAGWRSAWPSITRSGSPR